MNTQTGKIYDMADGETKAELARRVGAKESDIAMLKQRPDAACEKCNGAGARRVGVFSRRFKPCECTQ